MMRRVLPIQATACLTAAFGAGPLRAGAPPDDAPVSFTDAERRAIVQHLRSGPPPGDPTNRYASDPAAAHFGQFLFFDPRLSAGDRFSCASCHGPEQDFADGRPVSQAHGVGTRNTPSLLNVAWQRWFFWDGRSDTLWGQAIFPLEHPDEMGGDRVSIVRRLYDHPDLKRGYEAVFGQLPDARWLNALPAAACPPDIRREPDLNAAWAALDDETQQRVNGIIANLGKALAAYQLRLVSPPAPFDRFAAALRDGDPRAGELIPPAARRGLRFFLGDGQCRLCHSGPNFSDGEFHNIFVPPRERGAPLDPGRHAAIPALQRDPFNSRGAFSDDLASPRARMLEFLVNKPDNWGAQKTPSLRNVTRTAPYMHAGQFATLDDVLHYYSTLEGAVQMGHHARETILRPLELNAQQRADLVAFLETLAAPPVPADLRRRPERAWLSDKAIATDGAGGD